jgi:predicted DNA-binding transcriptional regulator AlpA
MKIKPEAVLAPVPATRAPLLSSSSMTPAVPSSPPPETPPSPATPRRLLEVAALQRRFGDEEISEQTIYRWSATGVLPRPIKIGRLVRWWEDEVEAALAAKERGGPTVKPVAEAAVALRSEPRLAKKAKPHRRKPRRRQSRLERGAAE